MAACAALALLAPTASAATPDWKQAAPVTAVADLDMPVDLDIAANGDIWFIELEGDVKRADAKTGEVTLVHHVPDVVTGGERGLVGLALAKDHTESGTYFLYYTKRTDDPQGGLNHLVRMDGHEETVLLTVPGAREHNGGRIAIDADGNLFVGTGENQLRDPAQDVKSVLGKILHLTPDGKPVAGNLEGLVYAKGVRNPFGLAVHPETGELWETENSGWRRDEVNIIKPGGNYGYPECEGFGLNGVGTPCPTNKGYTFPLRTFYETDAVAPTGATFWRGEFYWASLNEGSIHHLWQDAGGDWLDAIVYDREMPLFDLAVGPDDALYVAQAGSILKIALPDVDVGATDGTRQPGAGGEGQGGGGLARPDGVADTEGAPSIGLALLVVALGVALLARR